MPDEFIAPFISAMADSGIGYATLAAEFMSEIKGILGDSDKDKKKS